MRPHLPPRISTLAALAASVLSFILLACAPEQLLDAPPATTPVGGDHPELLPHSVALSVDVEKGEVRLVAPPGSDTTAVLPGLANSIIGNTELTVTTSNVVRGAPANGRVALTFDVAITNLLNSGQLVTPTFPAPPSGVTGLLLIPFQIRDKVGTGTVLRGPDWDGAPYNFFNDANCLLSFLSSSDCYPYEPFPGPLAAGATTAPRKVGFNVDRRVTSFTVLMVLAADIRNTPLPPASTGAIAGRVSSSQTGALSGVLVGAAGRRTPTDVAGGFQLTGIPVGSVAVTLDSLPIGCTAPAPVVATVLPGGIANLDLRVTCPEPPVTTGTIVGTVTSANRGPLYGVAIVANPGNHAGASGLTGEYTIPGVPAGPVSLALANLPAGCARPADQSVNLTAGGTATANFSVSCDESGTTGSLTGTLNGPGGPLAGVTVRLEPAQLTAITNTQGVYNFADLAPGSALISFTGFPAGCTNPGTQAVEILRGRGVALNLQVACLPLGTLAGTVRDLDGAPIADAHVTLHLGAQVLTMLSGADGRFSAGGLAPGDYSVEFEKRFSCPADQAPVSITAYQTTSRDFAFNCPPLLFGSVRVLNASFAHLAIQASTPQGVLTASLAEDGSYQLPRLEMVTAYQVSVVHGPEGCTGAGPEPLTTGRQQQAIERNFEISCPTGSIIGTLTDRSGQAVQGATVTAELVFNGDRYSATSEADGTYRIGNLRIGDYAIRSVSRAGCASPLPADLIVSQNEATDFSAELDCPARLEGVVSVPGGTVPPSLIVSVQPASAGPGLQAPVAADGSYGLTLPEGSYTVALLGLPSNCTAPAPQSLTLAQQGVVTRNWTLTCSTASGVVFTPADHAYGEVGVDVTRPSVVTVRNTSTSPVTISGLTWSGDAADFNERVALDCGAGTSPILQPGATCALTVWFTPTVTGTRSASLRVSWTGGSADLAFRGTGTNATDLAVAPAVLDLGEAAVGGLVADMFTITNNGPVPTGAFQPDRAGDVGDFQVVSSLPDACPQGLSLPSLEAGHACAIGLAFTPTVLGQRAMTVVLRARPGGRITVQVRGTAVPTVLSAAPASFDFKGVELTAPPVVTRIHLSNRSRGFTGPLTAAVSGPSPVEFAAQLDCPAGIGPVGSCDVVAFFKPQSEGQKSAIITVQGTGAGALQIPVSGSGGTPHLLSGVALDFGDVEVGARSEGTLTVTNDGTGSSAPLTVSVAPQSPTEFVATGGTCSGLRLAPATSCTVVIQFTPAALDQRTGFVNVSDGQTTAGSTLRGNGIPSSTAGTITGTLTASNHPGAYFAGQSVAINGHGVVTNASGGFRLTGIAPGSVTVAVSLTAPGCRSPAPVTLVVAAGEDRALEIPVDCPTGTIEGVVRDLDGTPVAGATVSGTGVGNYEFDGLTDASGGFRFTGVPEGLAGVAVSGGRCFSTPPQQVMVPGNGIIPSNFAVNCPGYLSGYVRSAASGDGVRGVRVAVEDQNGAASLPETLASGFYSFQLRDGQFKVYLLPFDVPAGCSASPMQTVDLHQQGRVEVNITVTCP